VVEKREEDMNEEEKEFKVRRGGRKGGREEGREGGREGGRGINDRPSFRTLWKVYGCLSPSTWPI